MKNVTVTIDDETHKAARVYAAQHGTSLSALVKDYLQGLGDGSPAQPAAQQGVREMPMPFHHAPSAGDGPPWFVNGKWSYTRDGKPRQPGGLRGKIGMAHDFDAWPPEMLAFFERLQSEPFDGDSFDPMP